MTAPELHTKREYKLASGRPFTLQQLANNHVHFHTTRKTGELVDRRITPAEARAIALKMFHDADSVTDGERLQLAAFTLGQEFVAAALMPPSAGDNSAVPNAAQGASAAAFDAPTTGAPASQPAASEPRAPVSNCRECG